MRQSVMWGLVSMLLLCANAGAQSDNDEYAQAIDEARRNMMASPPLALEAAQRAEEIVRTGYLGDQTDEGLARAQWLHAEARYRLAQLDEAKLIIDQARETIALMSDPKDDDLAASILLTTARIATAQSDFETAFRNLIEANTLFEQLGNSRSQAITLQEIATIQLRAGDYERAISYIDRSLAAYVDPAINLAGFNNRAEAYRSLGNHHDALLDYEAALDIARQLDSPSLKARILINIGLVHIELGAHETAHSALNQADGYLLSAGMLEMRRFVEGARAILAQRSGDIASAITFIDATFQDIDLDDTPHIFIDLHEVAVSIYRESGDAVLALSHLEAFNRLRENANSVSSSIISALMNAQFHFSQQDIEIERLRADQLENEVALSDERSRVQALVFGIILLAFVFGVVFLIVIIVNQLKIKSLNQFNLNYDTDTGLLSRFALCEWMDDKNNIDKSYILIAVSIDRRDVLIAALGFESFSQFVVILASRLFQINHDFKIAVISPGIIGIASHIDQLDQIDNKTKHIMRQITKICDAPIEVHSALIDLSIAMGITTRLPGEPAEKAIKCSLAAVDQARNDGVPYSEFDQIRFNRPAQALSLLSKMRQAILHGHMQIFYQPKLQLASNRISSAEALIRWFDPEQGNIPPDFFIPTAEQTGRIRELTVWTLNKILDDRNLLARAGFDLKIACNISGILLADRHFIEQAIADAGDKASEIILEITESAMIVDHSQTFESLVKLKSAGFMVSIDDYGTGYSSLSYIKDFNPDELKIDRSLLMDIDLDAKTRSIVGSTVNMAHELGIAVVAEGIETEKQMAAVRKLNIDYAQGYGICKPIGIADFEVFLKNNVF